MQFGKTLNTKVSHQQHLDCVKTTNYKIIAGTIWVEKIV